MHHEAQRRDLCEKIARWRSWSAFNEEATIQGIILPVLELAGYDTRNPEEVLPQARDNQGNKPDLMLYKTSPISDGVEWCVIEAKALGKPLNNYVAQVGQYLIASNAQWYVLTDGYEWRFFDKNHPQNNFYRASITLEQPGAIDALRCLLNKARPAPDFDCAVQTLIEARLREAARQVEWEDQLKVWQLTGGFLVKPVTDTLERLRQEFSEQLAYIDQLEADYKAHLTRSEPPEWLQETSSASVLLPQPLGTSSGIDNTAEPIRTIVKKGIKLRGYSPCRIYIRGQSYTVDDWVQALMRLIEVMDETNCLPKPPCPPGRTWGAYDSQPHKWIKPREFHSKQHGRLFVNKHGGAPQLAERIYSVVAHSNCPDITPETVLLCLHKRDRHE